MLAFTFTPLAAARMNRHGYTADDMLGTIPHMLSADDPAGVVDQIDAAYRDVGGGWRDMAGFTLDADAGKLTYPGDRPRLLIAEARLRDERILFFNGAWIVVLQPDDSFRAACID
jgi:hypothetical protein